MKTSGVFRKGFVVALLFVGVWRASAAYDAFLSVTGVSGESTASGHTNEITVLNFSLSVTNSGVAGSKPYFSGLTVTKVLDKASPLLVLDCAQSTTLSTVILTLRDQTTAHVEFYKITLHNAAVTSVMTGGDNSLARPTETIRFSFQRIDWEYQPVDTNGNAVGTPIQASFIANSPGA